MPDVGQINRDVRSDIQGSVGSLGKLKAGEIASKTEVVAKNLFEKYPNIERVLTAQMMAATYCSMIRDSTSLSEKEKQDRWEKFYDRVFSFVGPESSRSTPSKSPSRKESVKKPDKVSENPDKPSQAVPRGESKTQGKSPSQPERATRAPEQQASSQSATTPSGMGNITPDKTSPLPSVQSRPQQVTPPPVDDARIAQSAHPSVIPQDPVKAVQAVEGMRTGIREVIQKKETITFLITHPKDEQTYTAFISTLLSSACRETPRQCWFTQEGNPRDLDRPPVRGSSKRGIIVHGPDANALAHVLGSWFETYSTSHVPREMNGYKAEGTSYLIWIDIGPGSPWKQ